MKKQNRYYVSKDTHYQLIEIEKSEEYFFLKFSMLMMMLTMIVFVVAKNNLALDIFTN